MKTLPLSLGTTTATTWKTSRATAVTPSRRTSTPTKSSRPSSGAAPAEWAAPAAGNTNTSASAERRAARAAGQASPFSSAEDTRRTDGRSICCIAHKIYYRSLLPIPASCVPAVREAKCKVTLKKLPTLLWSRRESQVGCSSGGNLSIFLYTLLRRESRTRLPCAPLPSRLTVVKTCVM